MNSPAEARDVIYSDLDDEVTTIFERVRRTQHRHVVLVAPARALILQSLVSLKILRFKSEHAGKVLTIATKDAAGRELAREAGLAVSESARVRKKGARNEPLVADGSHKTGFQRKKFKIMEVAERACEKFRELSRDDIPFARVSPTRLGQKIWQKISGAVVAEEVSAADGSSQLVVRAPSHKILFALLGGAAVLLFFIVYIAVPTATVYVTPRADPLSKVVNVTLTDRVASAGPVGNAHTVPAEFIDFNFSRDIRIGATGQIFEGTHARGLITVFNRSPKEKFIVPSRFQSPEGLIFHTQKALTIPAAIGDQPGSIIAEVEACETDDPKCDCINEPESCEGNFVGARGNLAPTFFKLPAIPSLSPALYWAESQQPFAGGTTKITKFVSEEDVENVEGTVVYEIVNLAKEELRVLIEQKNKLENRTLTLLDDRQTIEIEVLALDIPPALAGKFQDDFNVAVAARVRAVAYEQDDLRALLFSQLETKVHPDKVLTKIKFDSAVLQVEEAELRTGNAKLAVTIEGVEEYDLSEETTAGNRLTEKIRSRILGRRADESEAYIRNLPEVSNAIISSWPFWARTIPELSENVKFHVKR